MGEIHTNYFTIKDMPQELRPYEKCLKFGVSSLTDEELLAVIIRTGTKGESSYLLSTRLTGLYENGRGLTGLLHTSIEELMAIKGIGKVKAIQIKCVFELSKRISMEKYKSSLDFRMPQTIADYYMESCRHLESEQTIVVYLDSKCRMICDKVMFTGTVNKSFLSPREIFKEGLRCNAVFLVILHNHPSGDSTPSRDDISSTVRLEQAGKLIGINLLDHIIIGDKNYTSLRQAGYIK